MRQFSTPEFFFLLKGLQWTIVLSLIALAVGGAFGFAIALLRVAPQRAVRLITSGYIQLFQGTPVLMQLFLVYYGLGVFFGLRLDPWTAVTVGFALYASAFLGEIWRGAIEAVPREQWEGAKALALGYWQVMRLVVLPQAVRIAIPPTVGFLVQLIKSTAIASIIGFVELTRAGQLMTNVTFQPMTIYPLVAVFYFLVCWPLSLASRRLERRMDLRRVTSGALAERTIAI
ncbi:MAG: amino acid ABC transporter permease [Proteobacteria bacterium]|nr:amino acid ABC transporter permease [Pseudomonadota bacterium]MBI3498103.1 amino acid ABC transporter permease [Pseudomonadota bacterium]